MNRKGFTLIELLATLVILALVLSIGTYAVTNIIKKSKEENYKLLISNIKDAAELYYQECNFANKGGNNTGILCREDGNVELGNLVEFGYLKGNKQDDDKKYTLVNPKDDENITGCTINVTYSGGKVIVNAVNPSGSCPSNEAYGNSSNEEDSQ